MPMKIKLFSPETKGYGSVQLPDGKYAFRVREVPEVTSSSKGRPRLQMPLLVTGGPHEGTKYTDWWNLPISTDAPDSFIPNFWKDIVSARPACYDAAGEMFDERALVGLEFQATVTTTKNESTGEDRTQLKFYRFSARDGAAAAPAAAGAVPAAAPASAAAPARFQPPPA